MEFIADILLIAFLIFFIYKGARDGFIDTLCSLLGIGVGLYGAKTFYETAARWLMKLTGWGTTFTHVLTFIIIFIVVNRLVNWLLYLAERILNIIARLPIIKRLNKALGGLGGLLVGIVSVGGGLYLLERFIHHPLIAILIHSTIAEYIKLVLNFLSPGLAKIILNL